jgi:tryptophan synthase alpha chain
LAGFGISNQEQIVDLTKYCDGVIVGSKIVDQFHKGKLVEMEKLMSVFKPISKMV